MLLPYGLALIAAWLSFTPRGPNAASIQTREVEYRQGATLLRGFIAWLFWCVIHIFFLIDARDRVLVAFNWLWDYLTFQRGARLITQVPPPDHG